MTSMLPCGLWRDSLGANSMTLAMSSSGKDREDPIDVLIQRARGGDRSALAELFRRSRPLLDRWAGQRLAAVRPGVDRPSDIAQETALRAFHRFASFSGTTEAEWCGWLRTILDSRTAQAFRNAGRLKRDELATLPLDSDLAATMAAEQTTASQIVAHKQHWRQTLANIYRLPPEQRDAIYLCHLQERPVAEAAAHLGKTEAAVAGLLRRGLQTLRAQAAGTDPSSEISEENDALDGVALALLRFLHYRDEGASMELEAVLAGTPEYSDELRSMLEWIAHIEGIRRKTSS